ncbi:hypothetical protein KUV64_14860 [Mameliella alba]|nr:hypothetical protein [Mameliella alba]
MSDAGAGRPVDKDGFPTGPWTPELLAAAISQIDANRTGVDLRTVQLWFQDNDKGVSPENIRWLARVFGCDDPEATSKWQAELSAAHARLVAKRRARRKRLESGDTQGRPDNSANEALENKVARTAEQPLDRDIAGSKAKQQFRLARASEAIFSRGSPLDLPATVFAGAVALGFTSFFLGIHSVAYARPDGLIKQVGFLWAPNWTFLFMVFMPLFFVFVVEMLAFWRNGARSRLAKLIDQTASIDAWTCKVEASSVTYWVVLIICLPFAGLFQWMATTLLPLIHGDRGDYAIDWGAVAIVHPEIVSVPASILFTGLAYLYMSLCFFLFFAGLILVYTLAHDLSEICGAVDYRQSAERHRDTEEILVKVLGGTFRCALLGVLVAICMKLQSAYVTTNAENILDWLRDDLTSVFKAGDALGEQIAYVRPTHYSSLLVTLAACFVFLHCALCLRTIWRHQEDETRYRVRGVMGLMLAVLALLVAGYLLIDAFSGFSILLGIGLLPAMYGLVDPTFGSGKEVDQGGNLSVS